MYDLSFKTEDLSEEVALKNPFGSYQSYQRQFSFNLEEVFAFVEAARSNRLT